MKVNKQESASVRGREGLRARPACGPVEAAITPEGRGPCGRRFCTPGTPTDPVEMR